MAAAMALMARWAHPHDETGNYLHVEAEDPRTVALVALAAVVSSSDVAAGLREHVLASRAQAFAEVAQSLGHAYRLAWAEMERVNGASEGAEQLTWEQRKAFHVMDTWRRALDHVNGLRRRDSGRAAAVVSSPPATPAADALDDAIWALAIDGLSQYDIQRIVRVAVLPTLAASPAVSLPGEAADWQRRAFDNQEAAHELAARVDKALELCNGWELAQSPSEEAARLVVVIRAALTESTGDYAAPSLPGEQPGGEPR